MKNTTKASAGNSGLLSHTTDRRIERNVIDVLIYTPKMQAVQLPPQNTKPIMATELCPPPNMNVKDLLQATRPQEPLSTSSAQLAREQP